DLPDPHACGGPGAARARAALGGGGLPQRDRAGPLAGAGGDREGGGTRDPGHPVHGRVQPGRGRGGAAGRGGGQPRTAHPGGRAAQDPGGHARAGRARHPGRVPQPGHAGLVLRARALAPGGLGPAALPVRLAVHASGGAALRLLARPGRAHRRRRRLERAGRVRPAPAGGAARGMSASSYTGPMKRVLLALSLLLPAVPAHADRVQVFSLQGAECEDCAGRIKQQLKGTRGVGKVEFDKKKVELTVKLDDGVSDDVVLAAAQRAGLKAVGGAGEGSYFPHPDYPGGADVAVLSRNGAAVGPLDKLRAEGKYTVFDVYAEWCGPCRTVDDHLRQVVAARADVAVRKLNV